MEYLIVSFRSRSHTMKFYEFLTANRVYAQIVNTPKEAGVGCGLSIKTKKENLYAVRRAVKMLSLSSFAGIFLINNGYGKRFITSI